MKRAAITCAAIGLAAGIAGEAMGQVGTQRVASGLSAPIFATHAPGDPNRLYVLERGGDVEILDLTTRTVNATPFLDIPTAQVNQSGEGGALGLAFDPDFATNGRFYVNLTTGAVGSTSDPFRTEVRRYTRTSANAAGTTFDTILSFNQPFDNHNGGWIGFNPVATGGARHDLYVASGDGGSSDDPLNNAQDVTDNPLGKILRVNVAAGGNGYIASTGNPFNGIAGDDEILAHGLRNPFRASFDRQTGRLYIGDVGQSAREEIDVLDPSVVDSGTGRAPIRNYGWRLREGTIATPTGGVGGAPPPNNVEPIYDYQRPGTANFPDQFEGRSVTGGIVYRGPVAELQGLYIFGDFATSRIWSFDPANPSGTITDRTAQFAPANGAGTIGGIAAFGEDAAGNLYIVDLGEFATPNSGELFVLVPEPTSVTALAGLSAVSLLRRRRRPLHAPDRRS